MVGGLDRFRDHFRDHTHQYALIGGSACDLLMEQVALPFRATKDLDIVLMAESLDASFAGSLWDFIRAGQYKVAESTDGTPRFYRFCAPQALPPGARTPPAVFRAIHRQRRHRCRAWRVAPVE